MSRHIKMISNDRGAPNFVRNVVYGKDIIYEVVPRKKDEKGRELPGNPGDGKIWDSIANGFIARGTAVECSDKGKEKTTKEEKVKSEADKEENKMMKGVTK